MEDSLAAGGSRELVAVVEAAETLRLEPVAVEVDREDEPVAGRGRRLELALEFVAGRVEVEAEGEGGLESEVSSVVKGEDVVAAELRLRRDRLLG